VSIKFIYGFIPIKIRQVVRTGNENNVFIINMDNKEVLKDVNYELMISKMKIRTLGLHSVLYKFNIEYRISSELKAFENVVLVNNKSIGTLNRISHYFKNKLKLGLSNDEIKSIVFKYYL